MKRIVALSGVVFGAVTECIFRRKLVHRYPFRAFDGFCIRFTFADITHSFAAFGVELSAGSGVRSTLNSITLFLECTFVDTAIDIGWVIVLYGAVGNGIDRRVGQELMNRGQFV